MNDVRPSPDALLAAAERENRGRLKIFLGAAPGVGKTYEMLMAGRAKRAEGVDVVIGVVETHGRKETEALVSGFELIPRAVVDYKGRPLEEMDLDAILTRHPRWSLFRDGCPGGESLADIEARADRLIASLRALDAPVLLFSSGHFLRALAARWVGLGVEGGAKLTLDTASVSVLGYDHDLTEPAIRQWNARR